MNKLLIVLALTLSFAANAHAQITGSLGGTYLSDYRGVELGAVVGSVGYRAGGDGGFSIQPEIRVGLGVTGDEVRGASTGPTSRLYDVDLDNLVGGALQIRYQIPGGVFVFVQPTMTRIDLSTGNALAIRSLNDADYELGGDVGAGFMLTDGFGLEGSVGVIDGDSVYSARMRFYF